MIYENRLVNDLIPYVNNARNHPPQQIEKIASSMREFGFVNPVIIDSKNNVIAGHGRIEAAKKLGLDEVPCLLVDHLSDAQRKAYILADNRIQLDSDWNEDLLKIELEGLEDLDFDLSLTGFDETELDTLFDNINFDPATEEEQGQLDELDPIWISCPHCGKEFNQRDNV